MREIKFRGKRVDNGEWVYGDLAHEPKGLFIRWIYKPSQNKFSWVNFKEKVIPETVAQYTGLKDREGKEIYEGDIDESGMVVKYEYATFILRSKNSDEYLCRFKAENLEIIGNIHDNPNLL